MRVEVRLSTYKIKQGLKEVWEVWYYEDDGTTTIRSDSSWTCKEDAEQDAFNRMLDGKI